MKAESKNLLQKTGMILIGPVAIVAAFLLAVAFFQYVWLPLRTTMAMHLCPEVYESIAEYTFDYGKYGEDRKELILYAYGEMDEERGREQIEVKRIPMTGTLKIFPDLIHHIDVAVGGVIFRQDSDIDGNTYVAYYMPLTDEFDMRWLEEELEAKKVGENIYMVNITVRDWGKMQDM